MCLFCEGTPSKKKQKSHFTVAQVKEMEDKIRKEVQSEMEQKYGVLTETAIKNQLQCFINKIDKGIDQRQEWSNNRIEQIRELRSYKNQITGAFHAGRITDKEDLALIASKVEMLLR